MKNANNFIILHDAECNLPMITNTTNIGHVEYGTYDKSEGKVERKTIVFFINPLEYKDETYTSMFVNETVERIYELIHQEK